MILNQFMTMLCGEFDNREQCVQEEAIGKSIHPHAKHNIHICNDKISNLPDGFLGYFVIEESFFDLVDRHVEKNYLFLYEQVFNSQIKLSSFNIPQEIPKEFFTNQNRELNFDYHKLEISPRFEPLILEFKDNEFFGENMSNFSETLVFKFNLRVTAEALFVKEVLERDGELIAGYYDPIVYKKVYGMGL